VKDCATDLNRVSDCNAHRDCAHNFGVMLPQQTQHPHKEVVVTLF